MRSARVELILDTLKGVRGAKDLTRAVDGTTGALAATAKQGERAGRAVDEAGDEMSEAARAAASLDRQVEKLSGSLRELAIAQALGKGDFAKQIREQESAMRRLTRNRKLFGDAGDDGAEQFASSFSARLGPLLTKLPISGPMLAAVGGAAAAAAPLLGAAIAGGIIGGAGIGGVVGGLVLAAKDPRVQAAAQGLGERVGSRLEDAAASFVTPAIAGLHEIERAADSIDFEQIFGQSSKFVLPLVSGVSSAITNIGDALEALVANAGGPIQAISDGITMIGKAASEGLKSLADNGEEGAAALRTVFGLISSGITVTFTLVNALTELYGIGQKIGADTGLQLVLKATGVSMDENTFSAQRTAGAVDDMGGAMAAAGAEAVAAANSLTGMAEASERLANKNLSAAEATLRLKEATKLAGKAADDHKAVSNKEESALLAMARATNNSTVALDEQGRTVGEATKAHEANRKKLIETAIKMGYTKTKAKELADQYLQTPKGVSTDIEQPGMKKSRDETLKYNAQLANLARQINTHVSVFGDKAASAKLGMLLTQQSALKRGVYISASAAAAAYRKNAGDGYGVPGYATGGRTGDMGEGKPAGVVHGKEFVLNAKTVRNVDAQAPGFLDQLHAANGKLPGYAGGGRVLDAPYRVNAAVTKIMSLEDALSRVTPAVPSGGRTSDWIVRAARALVPGIRVLSKDRPGARTLSGNRSYHSMGRAVDFQYSEKLARLWNANYKSRTKELISPYQQWNIHNGQRHRYTGAVWNQHNFSGGNPHDHIAMANGGVIREPVFGYGMRTGNTYGFAERGAERVTPIGSGSGANLGGVTININGADRSPREIATEVDRRLGRVMDIYARGAV